MTKPWQKLRNISEVRSFPSRKINISTAGNRCLFSLRQELWTGNFAINKFAYGEPAMQNFQRLYACLISFRISTVRKIRTPLIIDKLKYRKWCHRFQISCKEDVLWHRRSDAVSQMGQRRICGERSVSGVNQTVIKSVLGSNEPWIIASNFDLPTNQSFIVYFQHQHIPSNLSFNHACWRGIWTWFHAV